MLPSTHARRHKTTSNNPEIDACTSVTAHINFTLIGKRVIFINTVAVKMGRIQFITSK